MEMLYGSNQEIYIKLVEELQNYFAKGNDNYPSNAKEAYNLLVNYKTSFKPATILVDYSEEVLFANIGGSKIKSNSYNSGRDSGERKGWC